MLYTAASIDRGFRFFVPNRFTSYLSMGALVCAALGLPTTAPLFGQGEPSANIRAHFDDFDTELTALSEEIDVIVAAYAEDEPINEGIQTLIEHWESVKIHEVIEEKVIFLYPSIWQGIFAMKKVGEKDGSTAEMVRAGERTKAALRQGLGGLRTAVASEMPTAHAAAGMNHSGMGDTGADAALDSSTVVFTPNNQIELTGNDNMRYSQTYFTVRVGEPVTLRFTNVGNLPKEVMGHNVVVLKSGTEVESFGLAAAEASDNDFIPSEPEFADQIVAYTSLLGPADTEEITFILDDPGDFPFICSYTAHFRIMNGTIRAVEVEAMNPIDQILQQLQSAVKHYEAGDGQQAEKTVYAAYMTIFEGLEGELIERDPDLVSQLELDFNAGLPMLFKQGAPLAEVQKQYDSMEKNLKIAKRLLTEAEAERSSVF